MSYGSLLTDASIDALRGAIGLFAGLFVVPAPLVTIAKGLRDPVQISIASPRFTIVLATPPKKVAQGVRSDRARQLIVEGNSTDTPKQYIDYWTLSVALRASAPVPDGATEVAINPGLALSAMSVLQLRSIVDDETVWCDVGIVFHGGAGRRFAIGPHSIFGLELFAGESQIDELIERYPVRVRIEA